MSLKVFLAVALLAPSVVLSAPALAQSTQATAAKDSADLKLVLYVSRHGVRAPTGKAETYNALAAAPWPTWPVPAANLTPHGYRLMQLFGVYDRLQLTRQGVFHASGCEDAKAISIYADSDQRTRETSKALAEGLFPGCPPPVVALEEGTTDPLFHRTSTQMRATGSPLALAAVEGRIGGTPETLTEANRDGLDELQSVLNGCTRKPPATGSLTSLFSIPTAITASDGDHLVTLKGPLFTASTLTENLLLAYTEGKPPEEVGWGCVDGTRIRRLINLHTAATDLGQRTPAIATAQASNLLDHIERSLRQAVSHTAVPGARSKVADRALFIVGHDTNLLNIASMLRLDWLADGRRNDTAPGGALIFELAQDRNTKEFQVRLFYTVQTLEQMRQATPLTLAEPPQRVPVFLPACGRADFSCSWPAFQTALRQAIDPRFVDSN